MKKLAFVLALLLILSVWSSPAVTNFGRVDDHSASSFILPRALRSIGEEAFKGTAVESVVIADGVTAIGERAFADMHTLKMICVPESVEYIADHAFEGSMNLVIQGKTDSYISRWAREHGIAFTNSETAALNKLRLKRLVKESFLTLFALSAVSTIEYLWQFSRRKSVLKSMRPQDRPELYPINYRFP